MRNLTKHPGRDFTEVRLKREDGSSVGNCLRIEEQGAVFCSSQSFELLSSLRVRLEWSGEGCRCGMVELEAVIVGCERSPDSLFETTVLFFPSSKPVADSQAVQAQHWN